MYSISTATTQETRNRLIASIHSLEQTEKQNTSKKQNITIGNINIETENKYLKQYIIKKISKYKKRKVTKKLSDEIHEKILFLLKKKNILLPKIEGPLFSFTNNKLNIVYTIYHPYKYGFVLVGNKNLNSYQLLSKKTYKKYFNNNQLIRKVLSHIRRIYLKEGYANINLDHQIKIDYNNFIKTVFIPIIEGSQTKIEEIKIFGSFSRPESYYIRFIRAHSSPLIQKRIFYNQDIQKGLKNLINSLKNKGFLKATAHTRATNSSPNKVIIDIVLNEGPLTKIKEINFIGNKKFSREKLLNLIKTKINTGININYLEQDIQTLISSYRNEGFIEMELNNIEQIIQYNKKDNTVILNFNVIENEKIKISDVLIKGNNFTKEDFIINSLPVEKGDILTPQKIEFSIKKLRDLGIFSTINILTKDNNKTKAERTLIIQIEERKPRSLRFAIGFNTQRTLTARGFAEFSNKNIMGTGRYLFSHLKLQSNIAKYTQLSTSEPEYLEHQASISYTEPFLLSTRFNGQINLSNSDQIFSYNRKNNVSDIVNSTKINFQLNRIINHFINLTWTPISWEGRTEFKKTKTCLTSNKVFNPHLTSCDSNTLNIATTSVSLNIDKRDNIVSTSNGFLSQMSIEYSGPFYIITSSEEIKFIKMEVKHFDFRPIFKRWTWANSIQGGFIANMNNLKTGGFPVSRAFILGGMNSIRGFDGLIQGERIPDKNEFPINNANELIFSRSSFYFLVKTEMRFSIDNHFTGTLFYDGGTVLISGRNFKQPYRHSVGFGLRYKTPLGPVSGYLAFKINPKKDELSIVPHLSFGSF